MLSCPNILNNTQSCPVISNVGSCTLPLRLSVLGLILKCWVTHKSHTENLSKDPFLSIRGLHTWKLADLYLVIYLLSVRHFYAHSHRLYCAHSIGCIRMNNFAAEVTRLLCSLISTQLQQNLPRYLEVLKLQKEFEETCTSPGRYYICGGTGKEEIKKIIGDWKTKWNEEGWEPCSIVKTYGLGLVGKHSV